MSDTFERFQALTVQVLAVEASQVTKEASFADDLDADSLDLAELVMALEDEFDITVEEEELEDIKTVGQAFDMVSAKLGDVCLVMELRRVAVTGVGVLSSCGTGVDDFWAGLNAPPPEGERRVHDFDPTSVFDNPKEARRADRVTQLALAAATQALDQAGETDSDPLRRGVLIATGIGGIGTVEEQITVYVHKGARRVSPFLVPMMMPNAPSATVSMRWGWQGPCQTVSTACAAGTHALVDAAMWVATGRCDVVAAGGSEAAMTPVSLAGFTNMTAMSSRSISEPFAATRDGFVIAEGAGVLILEAWDGAVARGATILAEVLGGASTADAHHITAPSPGGRGALSCMEIALSTAGLTAGDVVQVNTHGTSTPLNDAAEAEAMAKLFGSPGPPVTSIKGVTGHSLGAAGAIEAVAVVESMRRRLIPPTAVTTEIDPELPPIDLVMGEARPWEPGPTLSNSFGFGGHNGTLVLGTGGR